MRLLIIEDDPQLRTQLAGHFRKSGWIVDEAANGRDGRYLAAEFPCDIAIVDLGLPDETGIDIVRSWREAGVVMPVLILTARADWKDKVGGLEAGADDYVTKPFYLEEVEARIHALLRRIAGRTTSRASYAGSLVLDFSERRVFCGDQEVTLTAFEYNTLAYLAHRAGQVVSKSELLDHLYAGDSDRDSNVLEVFVRRLRKKLQLTDNETLIETVRGAGYRFVLESHGSDSSQAGAAGEVNA
ncbi:MAG: response regulator transcription factor [Pseudomonadota bacterium]